MIINLLKAYGGHNGALNTALKKYTEPQPNNTKTKVDGAWRTFTPNRTYYEESPVEVKAYNDFRRNPQGMSPTRLAIAMRVAAAGGLHRHKPDHRWAPEDHNFRKRGVYLSSDAIGRLSYNPVSQVVYFKFRRKGGLSPTTYSAIMNSKQLYRWISSGSLGRYFNSRLKGRM